MRPSLRRFNLLALIGLAATPVLAGPGGALAPDAARRAMAALYMDESRTPRRTSAETNPHLRALESALTDLVGHAPALTLRVVPAREWFDLARDRGEPDATMIFDREARELAALDLPFDAHRLRLLAHVAGRAHVERALGARPSPWFEEGLAGYAASLEVRDDVARIGRPDADLRARARLELAHGPAAVERILGLEREAFARGERVHRDVAIAHELVHYLLHGGPRARRAFEAYVATLERTHDADAADRALLQALPLPALARGLADHVR